MGGGVSLSHALRHGYAQLRSTAATFRIVTARVPLQLDEVEPPASPWTLRLGSDLAPVVRNPVEYRIFGVGFARFRPGSEASRV